MKLRNLFFLLCISTGVLSGCQPLSGAATPTVQDSISIVLPAKTQSLVIPATVTATTTPVRQPLSVSQKSCESLQGPLPVLPNILLLPTERPIHQTLGGGLVQSTEFSIELLLYCDVVFQPTEPATGFHSDIGGLAVFYDWRYDAPYLGGPLEFYGGLVPDVRWIGGRGGDPLRQGSMSPGFSMGIALDPGNYPGFSKTNTLLFDFIILTEHRLSGAELSFDGQPGPDGLIISNVRIIPLPETTLKSLRGTLKTPSS